jgi:hypothetical protein
VVRTSAPRVDCRAAFMISATRLQCGSRRTAQSQLCLRCWVT